MPKKAELSEEDKALRERLGAAIRMASGQKNLKPKDLATAAGVSLAHQYRVEAGEQSADFLYLVKVAELLELSLDALIARSPKQPAPSSEAQPAVVHIAGTHSQHSSGDGAMMIGTLNNNGKKRK
jgi:hypothetical protein